MVETPLVLLAMFAMRKNACPEGPLPTVRDNPTCFTISWAGQPCSLMR